MKVARMTGGWIKVEKELINDPRVLRMASRLSNADVTQLSRNRLVVIGAIVTLWAFADTHIRRDNTLDAGKDEIDALVGVAGFCEVMPPDWLKVLDSDRVQLPGFLAHNGIDAKKKALAQRRQQKHRNDDTPSSRNRNAPSVTSALPDQDQDQDQDLKSKNRSARKTAPQPPQEFLDFKMLYPGRTGSQAWPAALRAANARIADGHHWNEMLAGASRYAAHIRSAGKEHTEFVKQAATFLGPDLFFLETWDSVKSKAEVHQNANITASQDWLINARTG